MKHDEFGDRMKAYEAVHDVRAEKGVPVVARIDGRSFSKFTKPFKRPFDEGMTYAMQATTAALVEATHAKMGYTQSDEITLIYEAPPAGEMFFDGRIAKLTSVLAGIASTEFTLLCPYTDRVQAMRPHFDCRVFTVPTRTEAANALLWRVQDCRKNAVQSIAHSMFSHNALHKKSQADMIEMMEAAGTYLHDFPQWNIFGTYMQRVSRKRLLTDEEWARIPESKKPDSREVMRSSVEQLPIGYFGDIKNRAEVIFDAESPQT